MKRRILILFSLIISIGGYAQLTLNQSYTPAQLIQNVFAGYGVTVSNITYSGHLQAIAEFGNGMNSTVAMPGGIIMSTGKAVDCIGPNSSGSITTNNGSGSDPDLASLANATLYDAAVFEFDFIPLSDTIKFRYVFSSDEYHEFANSSYNDAFGFFISGPNPNGGSYLSQNIAMLPNSTTPVTINNVNNGTSNGGPCANCTYFISNTNGVTIQYDGMTVILTAWAKVTPCQVYHFKIAIADAGDSSYDSAVFLEANSFSTNAVSITPTYTNPNAIKACIEGCNDLVIKVTIPKALTTNYVVNVDTMWGTATNGVDFPLLKDTIVIPAGQKTGYMTIKPFGDGIPEGTEYFYIIYQVTSCVSDTFVVKIIDYSPVKLNTCSDTAVCQDSATIYTIASFGIPPYNYLWTPIADIANPILPITKAGPTQTTSYIVAVTDSTKCPAVYDTVKVIVNEKPLVSFMPDKLNGCEPLNILFNDYTMPTPNSWLWDFGDGGTSTSQNPTHIFAAGLYDIKLDVTTPGGCKGTVTINNIITSHPKPTANYKAEPAITTIDNPTVQFTDLSTNANSWLWNFADPTSSDNTSTIQNPSHTYNSEGFYHTWLVVKTDKGCIDSTSIDVKVIVDEIELFNIITPNNDGLNDYFYIKNIDRIEYSHLKVYNRWGIKVFEVENYKNDWNGENLADGVYYFILDYRTFFREGTEQGTLTILRNK